MIVVDASVAVEILLRSSVGERALTRIEQERQIHVPEHFHIEVLSVLRRYSLQDELSERRAYKLIDLLRELRTVSYPNLLMSDEIWELRANLTCYDAAYLVLARHLNAQLLTLDRALAKLAARESRLLNLD